MGQSELERIALEQRANLLPRSHYNTGTDNLYSETHTRAKSDTETPVNGKGTGVYMDIDNGGGSHDIYGTPDNLMSGRTSNLAQNDYTKNNGYETPDTSGNIGQIIF